MRLGVPGGAYLDQRILHLLQQLNSDAKLRGALINEVFDRFFDFCAHSQRLPHILVHLLINVTSRRYLFEGGHGQPNVPGFPWRLGMFARLDLHFDIGDFLLHCLSKPHK